MRRGLLIALSLLTAACATSEPVQVKRAQTVYAILAEDDPVMAHVREAALGEHLAFVEANFERYAVAGPLLEETGAMTRSLFVIYADSEAEARAFMADDPYMAGGLYGAIEYRRFTPAAGDWIGGVIWDPAVSD
jgi:uncharacterized protein YciI